MPTKSFTDGELKRMAEQGFRTKGWLHYKDSPYNTAERKENEKKNTDNTRDNRQDSRT